jgi:hypothetical protein
MCFVHLVIALAMPGPPMAEWFMFRVRSRPVLVVKIGVPEALTMYERLILL